MEYDRRPVLRGVSLDIFAGEVIAILGANGSGKSTLVRALLGLVPLTGGRAEITGVPVRRFRGWERIGYVPQRLSAGGGVPATIREVVASGQVSRSRRFRLRTAQDRAAVTEALTSVGLGDRATDSVRELSGGQQQRVLIARALAARPDLFVMDEPMAGVDAASQRALARTVEALSRQGRTIMLVLHELGPLEPLIHRAITLEHGVIVHDGTPPRPESDRARLDRDHPRTGSERALTATPAPEVSHRD